MAPLACNGLSGRVEMSGIESSCQRELEAASTDVTQGRSTVGGVLRVVGNGQLSPFVCPGLFDQPRSSGPGKRKKSEAPNE